MTDNDSATADATCEECGAHLTEPEMQLALKRGGPVLCSLHIADVVSDDTDSLGAENEL
jgi:hypothetical protein